MKYNNTQFGCEDNIKIELGELGRVSWTGFLWLRIGRGDGRLYLQ
jgi:hypothetical protein